MILNKQVGVFLNLVHNRFKQYLTSIFRKQGYNISPEQFLVMDALWDNGVLSQQEIANYILKDKNSVVKLVDGLEKRGVVNKQDRRQNLIELSLDAMIIKKEITETALDAVNHIIKDIPQSELHTFIKVLNKMAENMNQDAKLLELIGSNNKTE